MTIFRVHFAIDMTGGIAMALIAVKIGEKICFTFDVMILGKPAHKRLQLFYEPCPACGWANRHALKLLCNDEKQI